MSTDLMQTGDGECNACSSTLKSTFRKEAGYSLLQCGYCGLIWIEPLPSRDDLFRHYTQGLSSRVAYYLGAELADRRTFQDFLRITLRYVDAPASCLDVGCNTGTFLQVAAELGLDPIGIEINEHAARIARARGLKVLVGTDELPFAECNFDLVHLGDVIEHLPNPAQAMRQILRVLRPGGGVLLSTPDISRWIVRRLQIKPAEHLYYFSPVSIRYLLEGVGFEVLHIQSYDRFKNIVALANSTTLRDIPAFTIPFRLLRRLVGQMVVRFPFDENLLVYARRPKIEEG